MNRRVSFWQARLLQGAVVFVVALMLLPIFWEILYLVSSGNFYLVASHLLDIEVLIWQPFPKSWLTATLIGLVLAARSTTWDSISIKFCLLTIFAAAFLVDLLLRVLALFVEQQTLVTNGLGYENFSSWENLVSLAAWMMAGLCFYGILWLGNFQRRRQIQARGRTVITFWLLLIYVVYAPILFDLVNVRVEYGADLIFVLARGDMEPGVNGLGGLLTVLVILSGVICLRRTKAGIPVILLIAPFLACLLLYGFILLTDGSRLDKAPLHFFYGLLIWLLIMAFISLIIFPLSAMMRDDGGDLHQFGGMAKSMRSARRLEVMVKVWIVIFVVGSLLYQLMSVVLRATLIGWPPVSFIFANIGMACLHAGVIFAGLVAFYACWRPRIDTSILFVCALVASPAGLLFPVPQLGISFGLFSDYIGWPMLLFLPVIICCGRIFNWMKRLRL